MGRIKKNISYLTEGDDVWGGWEDVDYVVDGKGGNDKLYGYIGNDELDGGDGDDEVYGGLGDDIIRGGQGKDKLFGGDGDDDIDGGEGDDEVFGGNGKDKLKGGNGKDKLFGGDGDDEIDGGDGDDMIFGEGGRNKICGGRGRDLIYGGDDTDEIYGGADEDTIYGGAGDDIIQGNEDGDTIYGGDGNDSIEGNEGDDTIFGENHDDTIVGNDGNDYINGGLGNDNLQGNLGDDYIYGYDGQDTLGGGDGSDILDGGNGNDILDGGAGSDQLYGEDGDDRLVGESVTGAGSIDLFVGGAGRDTFVLGDQAGAFYDDNDSATSGVADYAILRDFNRLEDTIELHGTANDYVVASITENLIPEYADTNTTGIFLDTNDNGAYDTADELVAAVENLSPGGLLLDASYMQYTDSLVVGPWNPSTDSEWELVFSEEFTVEAIDAAKWNTRYTRHNHYDGGTSPWNNESQYYVGDNEVIDGVTYDAFEFNNGVLSIVGQKVDQLITAEIGDPLPGHPDVKTFDYTSGILNGQNKAAFTYGYMEMRAKVPAGQGLWPAFWMLPTSGDWPPEIDIMETLGHRTDTVFNSLHYGDQSAVLSEKGEQTFSGLDFSADFHTFGAKWSENRLTWFLDGYALYDVAHDIPDVPMYLLANLAIGGDWPGAPDETTPETSSLDIDYIRVYQTESGTLHGGLADDILTKELGHLNGEAGNDTLTGGVGDNILIGGTGADTLIGGTGQTP